MQMYRKLPQSVKIKGKRYKVNSDFRLFIDFEEKMVEEEQVKLSEVIIKTLQKFYPAFFELLEEGLLEEAINKFLWFYLCGKNNNDNLSSSSKNKSRGRIFSYKYDSDLIWSAYYDKRIDLTVDKVHWWKFRAIWKSLPSNCEFCKVMSYRCYEGDDKNILELKEEHKLPLSKFEISEEERHNKIYKQLEEIGKNRGD